MLDFAKIPILIHKSTIECVVLLLLAEQSGNFPVEQDAPAATTVHLLLLVGLRNRFFVIEFES